MENSDGKSPKKNDEGVPPVHQGARRGSIERRMGRVLSREKIHEGMAEEAGDPKMKRSRSVGFSFHHLNNDSRDAGDDTRVIMEEDEDPTALVGTDNPMFVAKTEDQETDQVTPLRKASSKHLDPDERKPRFSVSSEMMDTLHRPVDIVMNTIRKITSHENIEGLRRNQSHVSFRDVDPQADERRPKFSIAGGRMGHRASFDSHISMEDVKHDLAERATELQRGISYPAFDIVNMDENEEDENSFRTAQKHRISTNSYQGRMNDRKFSMGYDSHETLPSILNYDDTANGKKRMTLEELRREREIAEEELVRNTGNETSVRHGAKLGWIQGVVLWTLQDMWAVQLFLRIAWMNAQAGIGLYTVIVLITLILGLLTTLSVSAISTNGEIGVGGTYYMMARSLGPQFGAAIGVVITLANTINVSLNVQGFADLITSLLSKSHLHMIDHVQDTRIISVLAIMAFTAIALCGMVVASKLKWVCLILLLVGAGDVIIGSIIKPTTPEEEARGFVGYSKNLFRENFKPDFQPDKFGDQSFMTVFAVFFPSLCGILAGTSITGDLRDPSGAIPKGTIVATLIAATLYLVLGWVSASVTLRHASGSVEDLRSGNLTSCKYDESCTDGMINNMEIMGLIGHFEPIIIAASFASTISTSLGCIHFAPKVFQALCRDNIIPGTRIFGKGFGKHDEPFLAYLLVMIIGVIFLMPSDFQFISNVVSNCFLMTYTLVNYATFDASFSRAPGWRPTFKYFNMWLSLATAIVCFGFMFALDWKSAIIAVGIVVVVWLFCHYRKPQVNWGTSGQANIYRAALTDALKLQKTQDHVKTYRPQILVLTGLPCVRPALVYMANAITRGAGLLICGHVIVGEPIAERKVMEEETYNWFFRRKVRAFYEYFAANNTTEGIRALIQTSGLGKLRPNILMLGYHHNWKIWNETSMEEYINVIHDAFDAKRGVILFFAKEGFDISEAVNFEQLVNDNARAVAAHEIKLNEEPEGSEEHAPALPLEVRNTEDPLLRSRIALAESLEPGRKNKIAGEIHVWWLYDDGGLTLLVPYLMTRQSPWNACKLRVFCLTGKDGDEQAARDNMRSLLAKFRISVLDVVAVNLDIEPQSDNVEEFNKLIHHYKYENMSSRRHNGPAVIMESDVIQYGRRTRRHLRLQESLREHSQSSALNVITMPLPKRNRSAILYLAILHVMTAGMPPTLLVRGNHENVLTYYC